MSVMGALAERQQFFATGVKPPRRFRDRASAQRMAEVGWIPERALLMSSAINRHDELD